jgi:hypothetical protein
VDQDGDCDASDADRFADSLGKCFGDADFWIHADGNHDGCITSDDAFVLDLPFELEIDLKPGSDTNSINCTNERAMLTVAVLSTAAFDASSLDTAALRFQGATEAHRDRTTGVPRRHVEDVNGDELRDLVLHFRLGETDLTCDSIGGLLLGTASHGHALIGGDHIRMVR